MSKGVVFAVVVAMLIVATNGQPYGTGSKQLITGWICWAFVMIALIGSLLVDAKGWP